MFSDPRPPSTPFLIGLRYQNCSEKQTQIISVSARTRLTPASTEIGVYQFCLFKCVKPYTNVFLLLKPPPEDLHQKHLPTQKAA